MLEYRNSTSLKGEYITFIDSDDTIKKDTFQLLLDELEEHPYTDVLEYPNNRKIRKS